MEVLVFCVIGLIVLAPVCGLVMWILESVATTLSWLKEIWPFALGCVVGIPLSLRAETNIIGNVIVAAGILGNVLWLYFCLRKNRNVSNLCNPLKSSSKRSF